MKNLIFITFFVISGSLFGQRVDVTVTGNWMKTIAPSDISEAGSDYPAAYASNENQTLLTIIPKNYGKKIYVYVHKEDNNWNTALTLKVKRTSNGTYANTNINDGLIYHTITDSSFASQINLFFTCYGPFVEIPLQYEITGISVVLPVESYSTTIVYTVMQ